MIARPKRRVLVLSAGGFGIVAVYATVYLILLFWVREVNNWKITRSTALLSTMI